METKGYKNILKLPDWLFQHNISIKSEKPYQNGRIYLLESCPFSSAHKDGAYAIQFGNGAIHAGCHHATCGGGKQRWNELRDLCETKEEKVKSREERLIAGKREWARKKTAAEGAGISQKRANKPPAGLYYEARVLKNPGTTGLRVCAGNGAGNKADSIRTDGAVEGSPVYAPAVHKQKPEQQDAGPEVLPEYAMTDAGNAERLIAAYGDRVRYCADFNARYLWNGNVWVRDDAGEMLLIATDVARYPCPLNPIRTLWITNSAFLISSSGTSVILFLIRISS